MKVKIKETTNITAPKYIYWDNKNVFSLKIQDVNKYVVLYSSNQIPVIPQIIIFSQIPQVKNYSKYTLFSSETIGYTFGCQTSFAAPNYVFPSWDQDIGIYSGITFGKIKVNDFFSLEKILPENETKPNFGLVC